MRLTLSFSDIIMEILQNCIFIILTSVVVNALKMRSIKPRETSIDTVDECKLMVNVNEGDDINLACYIDFGTNSFFLDPWERLRYFKDSSSWFKVLL